MATLEQCLVAVVEWQSSASGQLPVYVVLVKNVHITRSGILIPDRIKFFFFQQMKVNIHASGM